MKWDFKMVVLIVEWSLFWGGLKEFVFYFIKVIVILMFATYSETPINQPHKDQTKCSI